MVAAGVERVEIRGATVAVGVRRGARTVSLPAERLEEEGTGWSASWPELGLRVQLRLQSVGGALLLHATLENRGAAPLALEEVTPLYVAAPGEVRVGAGADRWSVFRNGYQSWSGTRAYRGGESDADPWWRFLRTIHTDVRHRASGKPGAQRSDLFTVIKNLRSGEALCLGFMRTGEAFGAVAVESVKKGFHSLRASLDLDGVELQPGERLTLAPLWISAGFDEHALLAAYAAALGAEMGARVGKRVPVGWCSWYYYFDRVREEDVLRNLESLAELRPRLPCDYVMIDDGYEPAIGDWLDANRKFPHGMAWLAERIRERGFDAGIWLAPFLARRESRLLAEHPGWFVRTPAGSLTNAVWNPVWSLRGSAYALDTTHPEVLEWLREVARTLARDWGYRVLKLDFLFAAALPGVRHDRRATRAQALRRGLEAIRAGAGEDVFLLGCGCPLGPAVGVVDGMRIGPDVAPYWHNWLSHGPLRGRHGVATENAIRNSLTRSFLHRRLWHNDPDCLTVRADRTRLDADEVRSLAAVVALTDGMFVLSDRMDRLAPDRLALLEQALRLRGGRARAVDLFESDIPELLLCERPGERLLAVFNFSDHPVTRSVDLGRFGVRAGTASELWSGAELAVLDGWLRLQIPAHGNCLLRL